MWGSRGWLSGGIRECCNDDDDGVCEGMRLRGGNVLCSRCRRQCSVV